VNIHTTTNFACINKLCGFRRPLLFLILLYMTAVLSSCVHKKAQVKPPVSMPGSFSTKGSAVMPEKWWTAFGDAKLNSFMDEALQGNFSIRIAWDKLDQARATAAKEGAPLWPSMDGSAGASRTVRKTNAGRVYTNELSLGLVASYEVDLWGRVRSTHDAARLDVSATKEDLHAAAITVTAEIAKAWYQLIEQEGQLKLLDEQVKTNEKYLEVITLKFRRGQVSATDVLQQQQLVQSTKSERVLVESAIKVLEHQLAILLARPPKSLAVKVPQKLPQLPPLPRTGLPAAWIRRRPDVRAAEIRVQASDQRVAAAIADQYPQLGLAITAETTAEKLRNLFDNWMASIAASLAAPLFDAGLRRAEVERTRAVVSEQLNTYGQVVLTSLQEVEDALSQEAKQAEYLASLRRQLELSGQATDQTLVNYTKGTTDFTRYLTTLLSHQKLQRTHLQAERDLVLYRIDLYRALAGSWALPRPPRAKVSGQKQPDKSPADSRRDDRVKPAGTERS